MSQPTHTIIGSKAREAILAGVNAIYEPVRRTLGPEPRKALLYRTYNRGSRIVDDGYTVAEVQEPKNIHVRLVATAVKEGCKRTNEKVGDGTATTGVILGALYNEIHPILEEGKTNFTAKQSSKVSPSVLRKKILASAEVVKEAILKTAIKIESLEDLEKVAIISVGDEKIGKILAKMAWEVGVDGFIDTVEGYKGEIETEVIKGFRFPAKIPAKAFVNNPSRFEMVIKDSNVLLTNLALDNAGAVAKTFGRLNDSGISKLIVIAPSFSDDVLINMVNATKAGFFMHPVAVPSLRTEQFEDLAIYLDAVFIDKGKGKTLQAVNPIDLGFLGKLVVKDTEAKEDAIATEGLGADKIKGRVETLKGQLAELKEENFKKLMERRIASISSAVGIVRVGGSTQASTLDLKMKIEDAVYACKSALRGGYVKGGGLCLKEIAESLPEGDVLYKALLAPYNQIQASVDGGIEIGPDVIDPAEAEYYAVEHATQVVANLITVDTITPEVEPVSEGDGLLVLARALNEFVISNKIHLGQLRESEREQAIDAMGGLYAEEKISLDQG